MGLLVKKIKVSIMHWDPMHKKARAAVKSVLTVYCLLAQTLPTSTPVRCIGSVQPHPLSPKLLQPNILGVVTPKPNACTKLLHRTRLGGTLP